MTPSRTTEILEALLLSTDRPLSAARLASVLSGVGPKEMEEQIGQLNASYEATGRSFRVRAVAGGYRLFTEPEFDAYVEALAVTTREARLSQAALETLAVVAYRQPVSKSDVEFVRGCDCDGVLRTLLSRRLVAIKGRSDAPGRPLLYATTDRFLEYFGLSSILDLPDWSEIAALVGESGSQGRLTLVRGVEGFPGLPVASTAAEDEAEPGKEAAGLEESSSRPQTKPESAELADVANTSVELAVSSSREDAT